ncbi:peptidase C48, SUMO/sentrin/Ubl1 [Tanacetum coccineum]
MHGLSPERKKVIREMRFEDLIEFLIFEIPTKLVFYVIDILSITNMMLECPMGDIVITPKTWKDQFRNVNKLTIKALSDVIIKTKNSDYMFRMNILTLIANTLGSRENSSTVNFTVLKNVFEGDDVSDIDWLMFLMITNLHYTKFDMLKVKIRLSAFKSWNTSLLKKREISELQNDYMGIGEIQDDVGEGEEPNQKEEIFKELDMPEYLSSSSSESDDDNDDGSQLVDNSLQGSQPTFDLGASPTYERMKILSEKKKKRGLRSKYVKKPVDPSIALTKDENLLGRSIFSTQEEEEEAEEVFNDGVRTILFRMCIQSLAPGMELDTQVIDAYVSILNYEEKFKMMNMKRHFFYTSMMLPRILEDKTKEFEKKVEAQYEKFQQMINIQMENDVENLQMEDVELAFFPIIAHGHYYLIVFNLKTGQAVIIDNNDSDATYEGKYNDNVNFVRQVFGRHLMMYENRNAEKILKVAKKATKEEINCGVYMIMHMGLY